MASAPPMQDTVLYESPLLDLLCQFMMIFASIHIKHNCSQSFQNVKEKLFKCKKGLKGVGQHCKSKYPQSKMLGLGKFEIDLMYSFGMISQVIFCRGS